MKRFFKRLGKVLVVWFVCTLLYNTFVPKPFKFEDFNDIEEAESYLNAHYPAGGDVNKLLQDLKKVGADCILGKERIPKQQMSLKLENDYDKLYLCDYYNDMISREPWWIYYIDIYVYPDNKIAGIFVVRWPKIEMP